jgi:hypothetical protein
MDLYEKTEAFLGRTIMKTPLRFFGFVIALVACILVFGTRASIYVGALFPLLILVMGLYFFVISILHAITMIKNPEKYAPKFCDYCDHVLPKNFVSKEDKERTLSREFEEQEDPIYVWMQAHPKQARRYSGEFVAITTKQHALPYTLLDHDVNFGALYHRVRPTPGEAQRTDFVIGRLP